MKWQATVKQANRNTSIDDDLNFDLTDMQSGIITAASFTHVSMRFVNVPQPLIPFVQSLWFLEGAKGNKQEQQALAWTETLTLLHAETDVTLQFNNTLAVFGEQNLIALTSIVLQINSWKRVAMGLGFNNN